MNKKRIAIYFMAIGLLVSSIVTPVVEANAGSGQNASLEVHSPEEIREYIKSNESYLNQSVSYIETPSTISPYSAGKLSEDTYEGALGMVKNIRYIAGLSTDIECDDVYNECAQAASLICAVNNTISHTPNRPVDMDDTLYNLGKTGAAESNLASGYSSLNNAILTGWMNDSNANNIDRLGHRRWVLNPAMKKIGFGIVNKYYAMHVIGGNVSTDNVTVMWPAQQMPLEYFFGGVWSVSTGNSEKISDISVKLVRQSDQRTWNFSQNEDTGSNDTGYFNVNNDGYGCKGCIIFRPDNIEYHVGDVYNVSISGSSIGEINYSTKFFALYPVESIILNNTTISMEEESQQFLSANVMPEEATEKNLVWESSDPSVVSVDNNGRLTALKEGTADIIVKATDGSGVNSKCEVSVTAKQACGDNAKYEFNEANGELRIFGTGKMYDYTQSYGDNPVPWKDVLTDIKSVRIESGITYIGQYAFAGRAYGNNKLSAAIESVVMADTVEEIADYAFFYCTNLSSVTLSDSLQNIGNNTFAEDVNLKEIIFPESLRLINSRAFQDCNIEQITIPDDTIIKYGAFNYNKLLTKLDVGENCTLHRAAFGECSSLVDVNLGEGCVFDDEDMVTPGPFYECKSLESINLPNSWVLYDSDKQYNYVLQFNDCEALTDITFNDDNPNYKVLNHVVYSLDGEQLIYYPRGLVSESYTILETTKEILNHAFYGQTHLKYVEIPDTVNKIDGRAFDGVIRLQSIVIPDSVTEIGAGSFYNIKKVAVSKSIDQISSGDGKKGIPAVFSKGLEVIYGKNDSYAETYANENDIPFEERIEVVFDATGGNVDKEYKVVLPDEPYFTLPIPTREGYSFLGWYTQEQGGEKIEYSTIVSENESHTLYAHWEDIKQPGDSGKKTSVIITTDDTPKIVATDMDTVFEYDSVNFTQLNRDLINEGGIVEFQLYAEKKPVSSVSAGEINALYSVVNNDKVIGECIDFSLYKVVTDTEGSVLQSRVTNLSTPAHISITIPLGDLVGKNGLEVVRIHDNGEEYVASCLADQDDDEETYTITTDRFSTYAIVYDSNVMPEQPTNDVWTGNTDISWYNENKTSFDINTPEQLAGIVRLLQQGKAFENKRINLTNDIFMNEESSDKNNEWILDGTECEFQGVFNGNGHSINNMYVPATCKGGLLGAIGESGVVKAINVKQGTFEYGGVIANENHGEILFCHNYSDVSSYSLGYVGGICNRNEGYIYGCGNYGNVNSQSAVVGGIVGINTTNEACVSESRNRGEVTSYDVVSGIVGSNYAWIYDCYNRGVLCGGRSLYGIANNLGQTARVINCYSIGNYEVNLDKLWFKDAIGNDEIVKNCYYTSSEIESEYAEEITHSELKQSRMPDRLNQPISGGFYSDAWQVDTNNINDGYPVTTAEISETKQQYKSKPEIWFPSIDKSIDLYDDEVKVSYTHYFDQSEAHVYIENTRLADISYDSGNDGESVITIKPRAVGESNIYVTYDETDDMQAVSRKFAIIISHEHVLNHVRAKEATYSSIGNIEYWHCDKCGKYYSDAGAVMEISQTETVIAKKEMPSIQPTTESSIADIIQKPVGPVIENQTISIPVEKVTENHGGNEDGSNSTNKTNAINTSNNSKTKNDDIDSHAEEDLNDSMYGLTNIDTPTKLNIKNKKNYKTSKKVKISDSDGLKTIKLNGKIIKIKTGKKSFSFKISKYKKYLKKRNQWNKLVVTDKNGVQKIVKFKIK